MTIGILEWLSGHAQLVSALTPLATLIVWLVWLQLMYSDYRSRRQPRMLLHQTEGFGPGSYCLLVNLSEEVIHIECVRAVAIGDGGESSISLGVQVELSEHRELGAAELENAIRQGPLRQGELMRLGSFEEILERIAGGKPPDGRKWLGPKDLAGVQRIEIRVVAVYGRSDRSVGASRRFDLYSKEEDDAVKVRPVDAYTRQLYSRRGRKRAEKWLKRCLEE